MYGTRLRRALVYLALTSGDVFLYDRPVVYRSRRALLQGSGQCWSRARASSPASPVQRPRLAQGQRLGMVLAQDHSRAASSAAYWSGARAASPACPVQPLLTTNAP